MRLEPGGILVLVGNDASIRDFMNLCAGARRLRREGPFPRERAGLGGAGRRCYACGNSWWNFCVASALPQI